MTLSSKLTLLFESIANTIGVLKDEHGNHGAEPVMGRRILYFMKRVHLPQVTNGEFFMLTGVGYNNECRGLDEMTAMEKILFDVCNKYYLKLLSEVRNDEEYFELRKAS